MFNLSHHDKDFPKKGRILVAPLSWGIGHATRCIPIIQQLLENNYTPVIASDGDALLLLRKVFPELEYYTLPDYRVSYSKSKFWFKIKLFSQIAHFYKTYKQEKIYIANLLKNTTIDVIISDNRFGVWHPNVLSIYITHQLQVKSGLLTRFTSFFHQILMKKYDRIWVPDLSGTINYSGTLSHGIRQIEGIEYIGILSQFHKQKKENKYDILVLLSGPEPQRTLLETTLFSTLEKLDKRICFIRGVVENHIIVNETNNIIIYNYLHSEQLQDVLNESLLVIARSGYSTIMDLAMLQKKAFFIPTPGQDEQLYLAKHLQQKRIAPYCKQDEFSVDKLKEIYDYSGF